MNKKLREEKRKLKFKKRLRNIGVTDPQILKKPKGEKYNYTGFIESGKPCSCFVCSSKKYNRAKEKQKVEPNS